MFAWDRLGLDSVLCSEFKTGTGGRANTVDCVCVKVESFQLLLVKSRKVYMRSKVCEVSMHLCEDMLCDATPYAMLRAQILKDSILEPD